MNSVSNTDSYKNICRLAFEDDNTFNRFKSDPSYNSILEHVSQEQGQLYLQNLNNNNFPYLLWLNDFKRNDIYGGTKTYYYNDIGNISPSTLRYMKVLSDLIKIFGDLNNKKILEIGVGYGGQCFILNQLFNIQKYTLVDMDEVLLLTNKYLNKLSVKHETINIKDVENIDEDFDLVISNYAYSELSKDLQNYYYEKIIKKSKHGYFTLNFISHLYNIDSYSFLELQEKFKEKQFNLLEELPKTSENNVILYY